MYLKSLKLVGFKSFADRTRLELRPGVTVVVGPNGSGKSNLVDAASWVMGTQSARSLRTPKMEDVVFAGTATRPALNRAEVTLVLDNESRTLPLDLDEVSITRRLYRDGSSDYELNGVACRLLDIQELLSDSGVGRHQHVIVGQGQIDSVLNSGPGEHRAVIEEAAGVLKHRQRKDRAVRRLERTDADVVRLQDIVGELERQMRPLRRQANAAEKHAALTAAVRDLRLFVAGERLRHLAGRRQRWEEERKELRQSISDREAEVDELAAGLRILTTDAGEVGEALDRDTAAAARLETILERLRRSASVAHERHRAALARRDGTEERRRDLTQERVAIEADMAAMGAELEGAERMADREERRFRSLEDEARSLSDQEGLTPEGALAVVRGEVRALEGAEHRDRREMEQVERRISVVSGQIDEEGGEADRLREEIRHLDERATPRQADYQRAVEERSRKQEHWEGVEGELNRARLEHASARARLEAVVAAAEGTADPEARDLVSAAPGHRGGLANLLDVPAHLAPAVDAALGPWSDAGVLETQSHLSSAVATLKSEGRGGVPVVAAGEGGAARAHQVAADLGVEALIDRLGRKADRSLAAALLGDVLLVEGWTAASSIVSRFPELRAVTPEGDLITSHGIRVAHPDGATPAMVEVAEVELERAETELARQDSLHTVARRDFDQSREREREALEALEALEARMSGASEALARITRARSNLEEELARLRQRREALQEASSARQEALDGLRVRLAALEGEEAERQRVWEEMESRRQALEGDRESARAAWQQATAELHALRERMS
ncbi:MAG: chromosome segregation SMC family protein, partial [Actinomycetota bacterium]